MPPNTQLIPGVSKLSRSQAFAKRGLYKPRTAAAKPTRKNKQAAPKTTTKKPIGGAANGGSRTVPCRRAPHHYPADPVPRPKRSRKAPKPAVLRRSLVPGAVLVLLSGRYRSKRVVFLKQLPSGLLLVSGPRSVNGVPLRRVNQAYVIATSTAIDISSVDLAKFDDAYFKQIAAEKKKATAEALFNEGAKKKPPTNPERVKNQTSVDGQLLAAIKKTPQLKSYLAAPFALRKGQFPHAIKF